MLDILRIKGDGRVFPLVLRWGGEVSMSAKPSGTTSSTGVLWQMNKGK